MISRRALVISESTQKRGLIQGDALSRFNFEQPIVLSEADYVRIFAGGASRARALRVVFGIGAGITCLFWSYTVALGLVLLLVSIASLVLPRLLPVGLASTYRGSPHLQKPMTCGVSDTEMWVNGSSYRFSSGWSNLTVWRESSGWLVLSPSGMSPVFLRQDDLRQAGVYDEVRTLARQYGVLYGSPSHRKDIERRVD